MLVRLNKSYSNNFLALLPTLQRPSAATRRSAREPQYPRSSQSSLVVPHLVALAATVLSLIALAAVAATTADLILVPTPDLIQAPTLAPIPAPTLVLTLVLIPDPTLAQTLAQTPVLKMAPRVETALAHLPTETSPLELLEHQLPAHLLLQLVLQTSPHPSRC